MMTTVAEEGEEGEEEEEQARLLPSSAISDRHSCTISTTTNRASGDDRHNNNSSGRWAKGGGGRGATDKRKFSMGDDDDSGGGDEEQQQPCSPRPDGHRRQEHRHVGLLLFLGITMAVAVVLAHMSPSSSSSYTTKTPASLHLQSSPSFSSIGLVEKWNGVVGDGGGGDGDEDDSSVVNNRLRPAAFEHCGTWQEEYMDLHRRMLQSEGEDEEHSKFLVSIAVQGGLADRVVGVISGFYYALLTGRAFQITNAGQKLPRFESAFEAPFINWTRPAGDSPKLTAHLLNTYKGIKDYQGRRPQPQSVDTRKYWGLYLVNRNDDNRFFAEQDLRQWPATTVTMGEGGENADGGQLQQKNADGQHADVETLFVASNRGRVYRLFDNPHHRQRLFDMGLRPETAFACAFNFLFAPNQAVKDAYRLETERLQIPPKTSGDGDDDVLRIGINIRAGDAVFDALTDVMDLSQFQGYFDCASEIEATRRRSNRTKVLWYVTSDSSAVRDMVLERYGPDKVVTQTGHILHGDCRARGEPCDGDSLAQSIITASGQLWAMALTDYQVITRLSGFGKVGAMLSNRWHNVYSLLPGETRKCGPHDYDSMEALADEWSGIRP